MAEENQNPENEDKKNEDLQASDENQASEEASKKEPEMISVDKEEYEKLKQEVKAHQDKYLRLLAESENVRKRLQKEKSELQQYAKENLICDFLTPIDQFENALGFKEGVSDEVKNWMVGFEMILTQFKDVLAQNDIKAIESMGKSFDPHFHEALEVEESDEHPMDTIIKEYVRGYQMGSRVIRPSKVKVTKKKEDASQKDNSDKKSNETIKHKEG